MPNVDKKKGFVPDASIFRAACTQVKGVDYVYRRRQGNVRMERGCGRCSVGRCGVLKVDCAVDPAMQSHEVFFDKVEMVLRR